MPMLTPEIAEQVANDETATQADRFSAMAYLNTRKLFGLLQRGVTIAPPPASPLAAAAKPKPRQREEDIVAIIECRIGDYPPNTGATASGNPWANVIAFIPHADGDRSKIKLLAWGAERSTELAAVGPGDFIRVKVREYGVDSYNGQQTKTARVGGVEIIAKGEPRPQPQPDSYSDFRGSFWRPESGNPPPAVPTIGADGWPTGTGDEPF